MKLWPRPRRFITVVTGGRRPQPVRRHTGHTRDTHGTHTMSRSRPIPERRSSVTARGRPAPLGGGETRGLKRKMSDEEGQETTKRARASLQSCCSLPDEEQSREEDHSRARTFSPQAQEISSSSSSASSSSSSSEADWPTVRDVFLAGYEEEEFLGRGSFGEVFSGVRKEDNLPVAIKHIPLGNVAWIPLTMDGVQYKLPLEVALLTMVGPGLDPVGSSAAVALIEWFELEDEVILIMERPVPCMDLHDYIEGSRSRRLQVDEAKVLMKQLLCAFIEIHARGVFHRDVKAENILVHTGPDGPRVRVIDFGFSTLLSPKYKDLVGTPDYLPPEFFLSHDYQAGPVTVWQLGVVLYRMLHCAFPFRDKHEIVFKQPRIRKRLPKACRQFLSRCLTKMPSHRPTLEELQNHRWLQ